MIFRKGKIEDAAAMARIFNHYITNSDVIFSDRLRSADDMETQIGPVLEGDYPFFIAEENGEPVGYCFAHAWLPDPVYAFTWEITEYLAVSDTGRGTGSELLRLTIEGCRGRAHSLVAFVTDTNKACCRMLTRFGFTHIGTLPETGWKFNAWHNDAIFQVIL